MDSVDLMDSIKKEFLFLKPYNCLLYDQVVHCGICHDEYESSLRQYDPHEVDYRHKKDIHFKDIFYVFPEAYIDYNRIF